MRKIHASEYIATLRDLVEDGKEVSLRVSGSSMTPFLVNDRDYIYFCQPQKPLKRGDMVFYQRDSGQFVMHRIYRIREEGYYIVGDAQWQIEGPIKREQVFAIVTKVKRKGKWLQSGDFWWIFFEKIWICIVPLRRGILWVYRKCNQF